MENYWIERDNGQIVGMFANEQYLGQESLANDHPDIVAWDVKQAQKIIDRDITAQQKQQDIMDNLPSWAQVETKWQN